MRYWLVAELDLWEEVHTDGGLCRKNVQHEFNALNIASAIKKAKKFLAKIPDRYPQKGSHGQIMFRKLTAELRIIQPLWRGELEPATVVKKQKSILTENKMTETILTTR